MRELAAKDPGGNSVMTRLEAELSFNAHRPNHTPVTDSSVTIGDLRMIHKAIKAVLPPAETTGEAGYERLHPGLSDVQKTEASMQMSEVTAGDDRPRPGDRVKLFGNHRWAGYTAVYLADRETPSGAKKPIVKVELRDVESVVMDPERQMRKL